MSTTDDYCELCDLPRSQCIHGRPAPVDPPAPAKTPRQPRPRAAAAPARVGVTKKAVSHRWTSPEVLSPIVVEVLQEAGGELPADDLLSEVREIIGDRLRPGDEELTPAGELRWHYAARRARQSLIGEGVMVAGRPGIWRLGQPED
ncbi:hypothetical protein [Nocardioides sp. CER19]|uniref:hypothetical protein n=1 Tax=Nocardioides sp. CER19 TaxID=3038538 RepID=UPI00244916F2|nr:hypothetical protein [Nocardioides sp. CER19]MDH2415763.1 hypothetical protein [Nocardioides sp. CER19]